MKFARLLIVRYEAYKGTIKFAQLIFIKKLLADTNSYVSCQVWRIASISQNSNAHLKCAIKYSGICYCFQASVQFSYDYASTKIVDFHSFIVHYLILTEVFCRMVIEHVIFEAIRICNKL